MKSGANGVDNGFLCLKNVKVPRVEMLDKFSHVDHEGKFISK